MPSLSDHIINVGNNGFPQPNGPFGTTESQIRANLQTFFDATKPAGAETRKLLLVSHGGLVDQSSALAWFSTIYEKILGLGVYPMIFVWNSDILSTIIDEIDDFGRAHTAHPAPEALTFAAPSISDAITDPLIELAVHDAGKNLWDKMKSDAELASTQLGGGLRVVAEVIDKLRSTDPTLEVHIVGHSAGAIVNGPLLDLLTQNGVVKTCTLLAPACSIDFFNQFYAPALNKVGLTSVFTMTPLAEREDNVAAVYRKSLLWLVSRSFESPSVSREGIPLLGLDEFLQNDAGILGLLGEGNLVLTPTVGAVEGGPSCSDATSHAGFVLEGDARLTLRATLCRVLGVSLIKPDFTI